MTYTRSQFSDIISISGRCMAIGKFVPLVPLMLQVAKTQIDTWILSEICYSNIKSLLVKKFSIVS